MKKNENKSCNNPEIWHTTTMKEQYYTMKEKFDKGQITEQEWKAFCFEVLAEILDDCKDVMVRLKERG